MVATPPFNMDGCVRATILTRHLSKTIRLKMHTQTEA